MRGWGTIADGFATRDLRMFLLGCAATSFALWAFTIVLAIAAYREGGTTAVTLAVLARVLPAALAAPYTALLGDRHSRRTLLLMLALGSSGLLAALAAAVAAGAPFAVVLVLTALYSALTTGQRPAQAALLPGLARTPRRLASANGLWSVSDNGAYFLGALAGGGAAAAWSLQAGFALTAAACALGALAFAATQADARPAHRSPRPGARVIDELLLGAREVGAAPDLREAVGLLAVLAVVDGALDVLIVVIALQFVDLGAGGVGLLNAAWGAGGLVGGLAIATLLARGRFAVAWFSCGLLIAAAVVAVTVLASPAVAIAGLALVGLGYAIGETAGQTLIQRLASDETLARAFGVTECTSQAAVAVGSIAASLLVSALDVRGALVAVAAAFAIVLLARRRAIGRLDSRAVVPERPLALLRRLDLFAPLSLATVETLAVRAAPVTVAAGEPIIREHDAGDTFYVIAEGDVDVRRDGAWLKRQGPGDYFGEIALLLDVPRTASVTAAAPGLLFSLNRFDFLAAVTGHVRSTQAADAVVTARLAGTGRSPPAAPPT